MDDEQEVTESVAGSAVDSASGASETGDSPKSLDDVYQVLAEIRDSGASSDSAPASELTTVVLDPSQYDRLTSIGGAGLQAQVLSIGVLALILGAVIATAMTVHWRGTRG